MALTQEAPKSNYSFVFRNLLAGGMYFFLQKLYENKCKITQLLFFHQIIHLYK